MACRVCDLKRQDHHKGRVVRSGEEVTDVSSHVVSFGDEPQPERAGDVGAEEDQNEETAFVVGEAVVQEDAGQDRDDDEGAVGDLH